MHPLLKSAWLKAERAHTHLDCLKARIETFSQTQLQCVAVDFDRQTGEKILWLARLLEDPPTELSPIIGDTLFNYRSALDHLMWALVIISGGKPNYRTQFPICETREDFLDPNRGGRMWRGVTPTIQAALEWEQPYNPRNPVGGRLLWLLASLNNFDKHRSFPLITWYYAGTEPMPMNIRLYRAISHQLTMNIGRKEKGAILARIPRDYVDVDFLPTFDVAFGEGSEAVNERVVSVLGGIDDLVRLHNILPDKVISSLVAISGRTWLIKLQPSSHGTRATVNPTAS